MAGGAHRRSAAHRYRVPGDLTLHRGRLERARPHLHPADRRSGAWSQADIDNANTFNPLTAIACPDVLLCIAADQNGNTIVGLGPSSRQIKATLTQQLKKLGPNVSTQLVDQRHVDISVDPPTAGALTVALYGIPRSQNHGGRGVRIAAGRATLNTGQKVHVGLVAVPGARQFLEQEPLRMLVAHATFTPTGASRSPSRPHSRSANTSDTHTSEEDPAGGSAGHKATWHTPPAVANLASTTQDPTPSPSLPVTNNRRPR